jgi:phage shock protein E
MKLILISLVLFVLSCPGQDSNQASNRTNEVALNQVFELKIGQQVIIKGERLKAKFISVVEDSRCPKGVQCIQEGQGRVSLQLTPRNKKSETVELSTASTGQEINFNGYQVKLVSLNPYPKGDRILKPADYVLSLTVSKNHSSGNAKTQ